MSTRGPSWKVKTKPNILKHPSEINHGYIEIDSKSLSTITLSFTLFSRLTSFDITLFVLFCSGLSIDRECPNMDVRLAQYSSGGGGECTQEL